MAVTLRRVARTSDVERRSIRSGSAWVHLRICRSGKRQSMGDDYSVLLLARPALVMRVLIPTCLQCNH
jgi:hypothetical protein